MSTLVAATDAPCSLPNASPSSLILAHRPQSRSLLILGSSKLAASRARAALESGAIPIVVGGLSASPPCDEVRRLAADGKIAWRDISQEPDVHLLRGLIGSPTEIHAKWAALIDEVDGEERNIFAACVTDTLHDGDEDPANPHHQGGGSGGSALTNQSSSVDRAALLARICRQRRIPINVTDKPLLCDFSFPATHRFPASSASLVSNAQPSSSKSCSPLMSSLQIAVTTNGRGCRLAGRIRREIVSALPRNVGDAVERVGEMRDLARGSEAPAETSQHALASDGFFDEAAKLVAATKGPVGCKSSFNSSAQSSRRGSQRQVSAETTEDDLTFDTTPLNSPVPQLGSPSSRSGFPTHSRQHSSTSLKDTLVASRFNTATAAASLGQVSKTAPQEAAAEKTKRRMRWVAQISEYWPMEYLGGMGAEQMREALRSFGDEEGATSHLKVVQKTQPVHESAKADPLVISDDGVPVESSQGRGRSRATPSTDKGESEESPVRPRARSQHSLAIFPPPPPRSATKGHIYLVGSGPGHPGLLTLLGHRLLISPSTHLILSDKLVPAPILRLIPATTPLIIAKKFPGNAEGAQSELISLALKAALEEGKNVVRLKQGDPFVYGRGGEEVLAFREKGVECTVVPGISSAIAAPLMVGLPVTQRGSADSLVLCTGVGRGGKKVKLPGYERGRSLIVLMGVARLAAVVDILTRGHGDVGQANQGTEAERQAEMEAQQGRTGAPFPPHTPIAIIERASSSDQRLLASTLSGISSALESCGEQRPPGMILIGWAVLSLEGKGNVDVLDDERECLEDIGGEAGQRELNRRDQERIKKWLDGREYVVREGLDHVYAKALADLAGTGNVDEEGSASSTAMADKSFKKEGSDLVDADGETKEDLFAPEVSAVDYSLSSRSTIGWSQGRYTVNGGKPQGGWVRGEKGFLEADPLTNGCHQHEG